jgi:hypothetical protein
LLVEESAPVDAEIRQEAEVIRQVRESDSTGVPTSTSHDQNSYVDHSSPFILPSVPGFTEAIDPLEENTISLDNNRYLENKGMTGAFGRFNDRSSSEYWSSTEMRTPPPPLFARASSLAVSDISMDSPFASTHQPMQETVTEGRAPTPQPLPAPVLRANKRVRDDEIEYSSIKRRAVSPGMSVANSPVLSQSPAPREGHWGPKSGSTNTTNNQHGGSTQGERSSSGGSLPSLTPNLGPKRVGLQAMGDTNEGLMKMSIE